ncbi:MAG: hypothetical protein LKJ71_09320 [Acetobacter peroxydans]|nr:hypothetical protein [Acetobacter peroxydans]
MIGLQGAFFSPEGIIGKGEQFFLFRDDFALFGQQGNQFLTGQVSLHRLCLLKKCAGSGVKGCCPFAGHQLTLSLQGERNFGSAQSGLNGNGHSPAKMVVRPNESEHLRFPVWEDKRENPADPLHSHFTVIFQ